MALVPVYDAFGQLTGWEEMGSNAPAEEPPTTVTAAPAPRTGGFTPGSGVTPPPNFFGETSTTTPTKVGRFEIADTFPEAPAEEPPPPSGGSGGGFTWPAFNAPMFDPGPAFVAPEPFAYDPFAAPTLEEAKAEPGYEFARSEGLRGLENSASARGVARTGGTLKDLIGWGNRFAEQNYGNVFNRSASVYDRNRMNAADAYKTNYGISKDVFDTNYGVRRDKFDRDYMGAKDTFAPKQRAAELTFDDLFRRWQAELDANTRIATAGAGL